MIKKILSFILAFVLVVVMIPFGETAAAGLPDGAARVFGADRYTTAFKAADTLKEELGVSKFQNVIVASGTGFADALAGSYLAAQKNAPILLVRGANVNDVKNYIKANLASGGTVYLLGGVNAVPKAMESGLEGFNVKRLGGANRYDTNLLILQEAGVGDKDIIVCTGLNFADSLSASATGLPILLVKDGLYANQKEFLKNNGGNFIVVGGINAVNATVEKQLASYGSVKRLAGNTRYDTSVLVAKEFFSNPTAAVLAYAKNFPDGLSGGPLAYALKAPLILTDNNKPTAAVNYGTSLGIKSGYVMGGPGLISDKVANDIFCQHQGNIEVSLSIDKDYIEMFTGETAVIKATATGSGTLTWSSSDTSVATVSDGKVTAKGAGTAIITATYGGKTATCKITVNKPVEVTLKLNKSSIELNVGETFTIKATYSGASGKPVWETSDAAVATVDSNGKVTAKSEGTAVITATYGGKKAQCYIDVYQNDEPTEPEIGPAVSVSKSGNNGSWDIGCVGNSLSFNAVAKTADGDNRGVTATSSNTGVATVSTSANGSRTSVKVSFKGSGSVTITLTSDDGKASTSFTINVRGYSAQDASTPEAYAAAINYVVGMNGATVTTSGAYTVLTIPAAKLTWGEALGQGQSLAHRAFENGGGAYAGCSYVGVDEYGEYVFYLYTS